MQGWFKIAGIHDRCIDEARHCCYVLVRVKLSASRFYHFGVGHIEAFKCIQ